MLIYSPQLNQIAATFEILLQHKVHYLHNMRLPINRLPSEIFSHILSYFKDSLTPFPHDRIFLWSDAPPLGSWHRASLVCRRWRQEVLGAPQLWTVIKVNDDSDAVYRWATAWMSRAGALPLAVIFNTTLNRHRSSQKDILKILSEWRRIHAICFYKEVQRKKLKTILKRVAGHLETLYVLAKSTYRQADLPYIFPRLQVLSVTRSSDWRMWSMHGLRYLCLASGSTYGWNVDVLDRFYNLLVNNAQLEELMLETIGIDIAEDDWNQVLSIVDSYTPVHMPCLRRLWIREQDHYYGLRPMIEFLGNALDLPPACARFYMTRNLSPRGARFYPVTRLVVNTSGTFVGTDGTTVGVLEAYGLGPRPVQPIDCAQVQELWLHTDLDRSPGDVLDWDGATLIKDMTNVTKLVIERKIQFWLQALEQSLPALKELHVLPQQDCERQAILRFLTHRKQNGLMVDSLRLIGDPSSRRSYRVFNSWKGISHDFSCQTNQVILEELHMPEWTYYRDTVVERLGLPEACKHPSPTSTIWQPVTSRLF